jgi:hypothetical protein
MDPLDREKPWGFLEQVAVITLAIGVIYLIMRFAVVVPDWGWQLILAVTLVGVALYYALAFRFGYRKGTKRNVPPRRLALEFFFALLLVVSLTLPLAIALFYLWSGWQL